jgi:hypothetical protein
MFIRIMSFGHPSSGLMISGSYPFVCFIHFVVSIWLAETIKYLKFKDDVTHKFNFFGISNERSLSQLKAYIGTNYFSYL